MPSRIDGWRILFPSTVWGELTTKTVANDSAFDSLTKNDQGETAMLTSTKDTQVAQLYANVHAIHYVEKDLPKAIGQYHSIIAKHPESREAGYSRSQILNITHSVVSKDALLEAHMNMALAQLSGVALPSKDTP